MPSADGPSPACTQQLNMVQASRRREVQKPTMAVSLVLLLGMAGAQTLPAGLDRLADLTGDGLPIV